jgi:predicted ATPase/class 3 adenylate cyclase
MSLPTGIVTFLFTDIEGSTRLWEQHPDTMRQALARHDALAAAIIEQHQGVLVKSRGEGDSLFAVFPRATDALVAALNLQQSLCAEPWPQETSLRVRMALHTGEADLRDGDYYGSSVNRCARLRAIGYGGQVLLSDVTHDLVRDSLPQGAGIKPLGEQRLRDLTRPEPTFQLLHPDLPADFPPLRSLDNPSLPNNLPLQVTSFVGREKESAQVKGLLEAAPLVTLTGSGGCGKTRLALQVAADLLDGMGDGVWLVELAALTDPALVAQTVANALGVKEEPGKTLQQTLVSFLKARRLLLLLDNCEHLLSACAQLADTLIRSCPHVKVLATSREGLGIVGETTYRVPSLSLPDPNHLPPVESLSQYEAVRLFLDRAGAVAPGFAVTNANAPALAQICHRLDGIPLAIELAAARVRAMSVEEINARLDHLFRLLTGGSRTVLPRHQTLRATIDWSYDLLTEPECLMLHRLSVFAGGWTLEAAEQVCADVAKRGEMEGKRATPTPTSVPFIEEWEVLDLLCSLVDKSLGVAEQKEGHTRYHLLETVRQYALDRLEESGEIQAVQDRHRDCFLQLAEQAEQTLFGPEEPAWLAQLVTEHDNLHAALLWSLVDSDGVQAGLHLAEALGWYCSLRGFLSEGRTYLDQVLSRRGAEERTKARARALYAAGLLAWWQGDFTQARLIAEEALAIFREIGDKRGVAMSLYGLGVNATTQGDYSTARGLYEESLEVYRELEYKHGIGRVLCSQGALARCQGEYTIARTLLEESIRIGRELGNQSYSASALLNLGYMALHQGNIAVARSHFKEGLHLARAAAGDSWGLVSYLESIAFLATAQGNTERAGWLLGAGEGLREATGVRHFPAEQEEYDRDVAAVRASLGEEAFATAWAVGRAMALEQAITYALEETSDQAG